jgi:hypothetical protein
MVDLMGLAAGLNLQEGTAAHHSQKSDDLTALQNGPVKGMTSRHSSSSAAIRSLDRILKNQSHAHEFLGRRRLFALDSQAMLQRLILAEVSVTDARFSSKPHGMERVGLDITEARGDNNRLSTCSKDDFQHKGMPQWATKAARRTRIRAKNRRRPSRTSHPKERNRLSNRILRWLGRASDPARRPCARRVKNCPRLRCGCRVNATVDLASPTRRVPCMFPTDC